MSFVGEAFSRDDSTHHERFLGNSEAASRLHMRILVLMLSRFNHSHYITLTHHSNTSTSFPSLSPAKLVRDLLSLFSLFVESFSVVV